MIQKTNAIVLKNIVYGESSSIVKLFTEDFGLKTFIIKAGRKPGNKLRSQIFQPLEIMSIAFQDKTKGSEILKLKEVDILFPLNKLRNDIIKVSISFVLTEIIINSLKEDIVNKDIFSFIRKAIVFINEAQSCDLKDFHLYFLYRFAIKLGFEPMDNYADCQDNYFSISKGKFVNSIQNDTLNLNISANLHKLFSSYDKQYCLISDSLSQRNQLFDSLLDFYKIHIFDRKNINSLDIVRQIIY